MDAFDIPDSSDWLGTPLAALAPVEQAFRCHVCKDLLNSPVLTSCNHSFCSLCIRRCLAVNGQCPLCKRSDQESKLRVNGALREAVDAFVQSREAVLSFARSMATGAATMGAVGRGSQEAEAAGTRPEITEVDETAPRPPSSASGQTRSSVKRKVVDLASDSPGDGVGEEKRTRMSTRASKTRAAEATATMMREELQEYIPGDGPLSSPPDDGLVACPICNGRMREAQVSPHMDTSCPGIKRPTKKSSTPFFQPSHHAIAQRGLAAPPSLAKKPAAPASRSGPVPRTMRSNQLLQQEQTNIPRLPALHYSLLNDSSLRRRMNALGLSTQGCTRQTLERRHQEWVNLWNANCDSARPKTQSALMRDLDEWERAMRNNGGGGGGGGVGGQLSTMGLGGASGGVGGGGSSSSSSTTPQIREKDFDSVGWMAKNESSFADLITDARQTARQAAQDKAHASKDENKSSSSNSGSGGGDDHAHGVSGAAEQKGDEAGAGPGTELLAPSSKPSCPEMII